jgi:hypothetical protein
MLRDEKNICQLIIESREISVQILLMSDIENFIVPSRARAFFQIQGFPAPIHMNNFNLEIFA